MAEQFSAEWAKGVIDGGLGKAQEVIGDPEKVNDLLAQLQEKLGEVPEAVGNAFKNVPLMASMVKSYVTREYTDVSPKVVVSLVSAFLYLVAKKDIIPDNIPVVGLADDLAVATIVMAINEPELKAYAEWREQREADQAAAQEAPQEAPQEAEIVAVEPVEPAEA